MTTRNLGWMLRLWAPACAFFAIAMAPTDAWAMSAQTAEQIATKLLTLSGYKLAGNIQVDTKRSSGMAAVTMDGKYATIFVHPDLLAQSENTVAFVIGHELAHRILDSGNEQSADFKGLQIAANAGYNARAFADWLNSLPNSCDAAHGCLHHRAALIRLLAQSPDMAGALAGAASPRVMPDRCETFHGVTCSGGSPQQSTEAAPAATQPRTSEQDASNTPRSSRTNASGRPSWPQVDFTETLRRAQQQTEENFQRARQRAEENFQRAVQESAERAQRWQQQGAERARRYFQDASSPFPAASGSQSGRFAPLASPPVYAAPRTVVPPQRSRTTTSFGNGWSLYPQLR